MKKIAIVLILLGMLAASLFYFARTGDAETASYRFVSVERGDLEAVVSATGALSAVTTVQVGTQVSGRVDEIFVDFNDRVKRGQLVARIDDTILRQAVRDAEATIERNRAEVVQREREFERTSQLHEQQGVTDQEYDTAEYSLAVARANLTSAQVNLERSENNLAYTLIYAPIDGVVIERNVDVGQTVAASLSAPQLFLIANDLAQLEILASVDESDIGRIEEERPVRFTVQAYPDESFDGTVRQVRLQSASQENVVNYTVVVNVDNVDGKLLPGMTATVDFLIETVTDVLLVPNAALRFRPNEEMMTAFRERMQQRFAEARENVPDSVRENFQARAGAAQAEGDGSPRAGAEDGAELNGPRGGERAGQGGSAGAEGRGGFGGPGGPGGFGGAGGFGGGQGRPGTGQLWYLDENGELAAMRVRIGISDGQSTEIQGRDLEAGLAIIAGVTQGSASSTPNNPFQQQPQSGGRRRF